MAKKKVAVTHALPETIYVYQDNDEPANPVLIAGSSLEDIADTRRRVVGMYELVQVGHLQNVPSYEEL